MAKGNPIVPVRFTPEKIEELRTICVRSVMYGRGEPYDLSSFIRKAVEEKIAHMERSRKSRKKKVAK